MSTDRACFFIPEVGDYKVIEGREIVVTPVPGAGLREVRLYLLGWAWAVLCYQRDLLLLHASAVRVGDGAVVFCGPSGAGKSTVAAGLAGSGYMLVSDDLSRVDIHIGQSPLIWCTAVRLKLWRDTLDALGWHTDGLERDHYRTDKFHLPWPMDGSLQPVHLRAIYVLAWGEPAIVPLTGVTALRRFMAAATYRGDLLTAMGKLAMHWEWCVDLLRRVPVFALHRPQTLHSLDLTLSMLARQWQNGRIENE
jgi:hypothetical protein